jgi:hypothetical protein
MGGRMPDGRTRLSASASDEPTEVDLETLLRRRTSLRMRLIQVGALLLVAAVVMAVVLRQVASVPGGNSAQPASGPGPVVAVSNVSEGTITMNGHVLPGSTPLILPVRQGTNWITFTAAPFLPHSCRLQWEPDGWEGGDCTAEGRDTTVVIDGQPIHPNAILYFGLTDLDLPADQADRAQAAVAGALTQQGGVVASVAPGEYIATGGDWPLQATSPLKAAVTYSLCSSRDATTCLGSFPPVLSAGPLLLETTPPGAVLTWVVTLAAYYHWSFASLGLDSSSYSLQPSRTLALTYSAAEGWQVALPNRYPPGGSFQDRLKADLCGAGQSALLSSAEDASQEAFQDTTQVVRDRQVSGCEIALFTAQRTNAGRYIWRFGVLLAVDATAHTTLPGLPMAPEQEIAAVEAS